VHLLPLSKHILDPPLLTSLLCNNTLHMAGPWLWYVDTITLLLAASWSPMTSMMQSCSLSSSSTELARCPTTSELQNGASRVSALYSRVGSAALWIHPICTVRMIMHVPGPVLWPRPRPRPGASSWVSRHAPGARLCWAPSQHFTLQHYLFFFCEH
jgi:hypothetical protein